MKIAHRSDDDDDDDGGSERVVPDATWNTNGATAAVCTTYYCLNAKIMNLGALSLSFNVIQRHAGKTT
jgi:hypothetical protein